MALPTDMIWIPASGAIKLNIFSRRHTISDTKVCNLVGYRCLIFKRRAPAFLATIGPVAQRRNRQDHHPSVSRTVVLPTPRVDR